MEITRPTAAPVPWQFIHDSVNSSARVCVYVCSLCSSQICLAEVGPGPLVMTATGEPRRSEFGFWVCSLDHRFYAGIRSISCFDQEWEIL